MKKKLPQVKNTNNTSAREYLENKMNKKSSKIPTELSDYLCEREVYTPENYEKVRDKYSNFILENTDEITSACATHNTNAFMTFYESAMALTNDFVIGRMIMHCCIQEFSLVGGMVSLFEWGDDLMIQHLHSSDKFNR